jgi:hypothetical protein
LVKGWATGRLSPIAIFLGDQALHGLVLVAVALWATGGLALAWPDWAGFVGLAWSPVGLSMLWALASLLAVTQAAGYGVAALTRPLVAHLRRDRLEDGLPGAGRLIGYLERLILLALVVAGQPQAIGWLLTAKSILRLGEGLRAGSERRFLEYILIGTLASFAAGIAVSWAAVRVGRSYALPGW